MNAGCTNTVTLNLTINNSTTLTYTQEACDLYTWPSNGITYTKSGTYTYDQEESCSSTTLELTINNCLNGATETVISAVCAFGSTQLQEGTESTETKIIKKPTKTNDIIKQSVIAGAAAATVSTLINRLSSKKSNTRSMAVKAFLLTPIINYYYNL
jgi:hypothetical protein